MATLETNDPNILDAETVNWQVVVFPILAALLIILGGFGYYYYQQGQREALEAQARDALMQAKTPAEMIKVADQFPHTDQQILALFGAANASFAARDFGSAASSYQRVMDTAGVAPELRDSAELGLASTQEATGKQDDAIKSYLEVAHRGGKSPYAPYACNSVARIYEQRGDKMNENEILTETASLDPDSPFVKQAQYKLKQMSTPAAPAMAIPLNPVAPSPAPSAPAVPPPAPAQK